jgi:serine/threonine protein kinase
MDKPTGTVLIQGSDGNEVEFSYSFIAGGGFGKVYSLINKNTPNTNTNTKPTMVMKVFHKEEMLRAEQKILDKIADKVAETDDIRKHNLCLDLPEWKVKGHYALVFPYFPMTLKELWFKAYAVLTPETAGKILETIWTTLKFLHSKQIYHRDIKPENIYVDYDESSFQLKKVVLGDFGLTLFSDAPSMHGSLLYMSPWIFMNRPDPKGLNDEWAWMCLCINFLTLHRTLVMDENGEVYIEKDYLYLYIHPSLKTGEDTNGNVFIQTMTAIGKIPKEMCELALQMKKVPLNVLENMVVLTTNIITDRYEEDDSDECYSIIDCLEKGDAVIKSVADWKYIGKNEAEAETEADAEAENLIQTYLVRAYHVLMKFYEGDKKECQMVGGMVEQTIAETKEDLKETERLKKETREPYANVNVNGRMGGSGRGKITNTSKKSSH